MLIIGWALLTPAGQQPQWWLLLVAIAAVVGFVGSWHGQHLSSSVRRWAPMTRRNRRRRRHPGSQAPPRPRNGHRAAAKRTDTRQARVVIHLRPHPHALTTASSNTDQMPWEFITAWLDRYGVRADTLTVCSVTTTPPASSLRSGDAAPLLTGHTPQHRDTWLTYTLRAESNVAELTARRTTMASANTESESADSGPRRAALADTTARRMIAELRERGWLATLCDDATQLPRFVRPDAQLRRECWTGTEYSDGFRAVYAIEPQALNAVLSALPAMGTKRPPG